MQINGLSLIGSSTGAQGNSSFKAIDPSTSTEIEPSFYAATADETNRAADLAQRAYLKYSRKSGAERAGFLRAIADQIEGLGDTLTRRAMAETGLPEGRIQGETGRTTGQLRLFATVAEEGSWVEARIDTALPYRQPIPKPDIRSMKRPLGPVAVFAASNFPLAFSVAGGDTASALAAGCPVIVKAHSSHPGTSELVAQAILAAIEQTGMPEGTFSLLHGSGRVVGSALVAHPSIQAVGFTGSTAGGLALMKLAGSRPQPIPVFAEMGSVNPVFILPEAAAANGAGLASGLQVSATMGVGQFCTNPGVVLVESSDSGNALVSSFTEEMAKAPSAIMLNPNIHSAYTSGVVSRSDNQKVNTLVINDDHGSGCPGVAAVFEVSADTFLEDESLSEEIFGPETTLVRWKSKQDLMAVAEELDGQLTATIHGTEADLEEYADLIAILERKVGRIVYNGFPTGVEVCHSMVHGGPFPATSDGKSTSVGTHAIERFIRLVAYQSSPQSLLPDELKDGNPLGIWRLVNGEYTR
jgi:NADP-dependent aldehyde dehydrogenase